VRAEERHQRLAAAVEGHRSGLETVRPLEPLPREVDRRPDADVADDELARVRLGPGDHFLERLERRVWMGEEQLLGRVDAADRREVVRPLGPAGLDRRQDAVAVGMPEEDRVAVRLGLRRHLRGDRSCATGLELNDQRLPE
jgi:hypothetical protein